MDESLVSIIIPVYNKAKYLKSTIESILAQSYSSWEALFINDCSTDNSVQIISENMKGNYRIIDMPVNSGAALARNEGIKQARGRYIAFFDADDMWLKDKLKLQIEFISTNDYAFTFTDYQFADESGTPSGRCTNIPIKMNYDNALKNTTIFTSTVILDLNSLTKSDIYMPNVHYEDTATWWKILKKTQYAYGLKMPLSIYRTGHSSLSSNKLSAIGRVWGLYRNVEGLSIGKSLWCFSCYARNAFSRRYL